MRPVRSTARTTARPSAMVRLMGFSHQTSLPASTAAAEMSACQWGGVAMWTTSMSGLSSTSRKSRYPLTPGPALWSAEARWALSTSHTARNTAPGYVRWLRPMPPTPITALVNMSLGGIVPGPPRTWRGTMVTAATAAAVLRANCRRVIGRGWDMGAPLLGHWHYRDSGMAKLSSLPRPFRFRSSAAQRPKTRRRVFAGCRASPNFANRSARSAQN